jgi:hypothetical protein
VAVDEVAEAKATFMAKHPEAFWAEFADFSVWRMDALLKARCVPMRSPPPQEHQGVWSICRSRGAWIRPKDAPRLHTLVLLLVPELVLELKSSWVVASRCVARSTF